MKNLFFNTSLVLQICVFFQLSAQKPTDITVAFFKNPEKAIITDSTPEFGWHYKTNKKADFQTAYQILVSTSSVLIEKNKGDVWDSGKISSVNSSNVEFGGELLQSHTTYYWKVRLWDKDGSGTPYSDYQSFSTGNLNNKYMTDRYPLVCEKIKPLFIVHKNTSGYFIDFGNDAFGTLEVIFTSSKMDTVEIYLGEKLTSPKTIDRNPGGTIRFLKVLLPISNGTHTYKLQLPPGKRNTGKRAIHLPDEIGVVMPFRYCEIIHSPSPVDTSTISQLAVFYPIDQEAADFSSSDTVLNQIWDLCKYSIKATSFTGVYIDGDRERIPYEADAYINQLGHYCVDEEYNMARFSHEYLITHPTWPTEWILHSVLMTYADYMFTGNTESIRQYYQDLQAKTLISLARADGLISTRTGKVTPEVLRSIHLNDNLKDIVDWPKGERDGYEMVEVNTVVNAFHYKALRLMAELAKIIKRPEDEYHYRKRADMVKKSINEKLFDPQKGLYVDGEGSSHASLHANMFPLAFGLVPEKHLKRVTEFVKSRGMACSVYGAQYLMEALYGAAEAEHALQMLTDTTDRSWWNMIRSGSTISMEAWDKKYKLNLDWNHAWGAVPANIIPRFLWGIRPLEPGFSKFVIKPQFAGLTHSKIKMPTIKGPIIAEYRGEAGKSYTLEVEIPFNTTATIYLPNLNKAFVYQINGQMQAGTGNTDHIIIELGSGHYKLEVRE